MRNFNCFVHIGHLGRPIYNAEFKNPPANLSQHNEIIALLFY